MAITMRADAHADAGSGSGPRGLQHPTGSARDLHRRAVCHRPGAVSRLGRSVDRFVPRGRGSATCWGGMSEPRRRPCVAPFGRDQPAPTGRVAAGHADPIRHVIERLHRTGKLDLQGGCSDGQPPLFGETKEIIMPGIMSEGAGPTFVPRCATRRGRRSPHRDGGGRRRSSTRSRPRCGRGSRRRPPCCAARSARSAPGR
jgi:hypothetical protein